MAGISSWSRGDRIAFVSLIVAIVGVIAAIVVVPEVRVFLGLEHPEPKVNDVQMLILAEQVLPEQRAYDWNQALMDMGATICTSNNPQCVGCSLQLTCQAYKDMSQHSLFPSGTVLRQLRKVAEKKPGYQTQPFTNSNRYFRGRIIDLLRTLPTPTSRLSLLDLGLKIKPTFTPEDLPWLQKIVNGLLRDGLLDVTEDGVRLP